jgi:UDP-glucuronate 4-epimerase
MQVEIDNQRVLRNMAQLEERFLVTGAGGCIGAWAVRLLLDAGVQVIASDVRRDLHRLELISADSIEDLDFAILDVTDTAAVAATVAEQQITNIIHLAGLQVPFCAANPPLGAMVNVTGTVNIFDAIRAAERPIGLSFASSAAVFGKRSRYPDGKVDDSSPVAPTTHYGVYKVANEGTARVYAADHQIGSIGLRPFVVYGPGRDQGRTSGPTMAMLAAAADVHYTIPLGGTALLTYAADCAQAFIAASRTAVGSSESSCLNVPGHTVSMNSIVDAIQVAHPAAKGRIAIAEVESLTPAALGASAMDSVLGTSPPRPLEEGIAETMEYFARALSAGTLSAPTLSAPTLSAPTLSAPTGSTR